MLITDITFNYSPSEGSTTSLTLTDREGFGANPNLVNIAQKSIDNLGWD